MSKWLVSYMSVNGLDSYKVPPKCVTEVIQIPDHETPVDWFLRESQKNICDDHPICLLAFWKM